MNQPQRTPPMQNSPNPQDNQIYIPPQQKHTTLAISLILIILIGACGLYFAIKPKLQNKIVKTEC